MDIGNRTGAERLPGAALSRDLASASAPGEVAEKQLDNFISNRDTQRRRDGGERSGANELERVWGEAEERAEEQRCQERRLAGSPTSGASGASTSASTKRRT